VNINLKSLDIGDKGNFGISISGGSTDPSTNITVDSCKIDSRYTFDYTQAGTIITAGYTSDRGPREGFYGRWSNHVEFKNSTVTNYTHANINLQHSSTGKNCEYYNIHDNYSTSNIAYGGRTVVDNGTYYLEFHNNTIDGSNVQNQLQGQNNHFHHNIIKSVKSSPLNHFHSGWGISVRPYAGEDVINNIYENNIIIDCESGGITIGNYKNYTTGATTIVTNCIFRNNILVNNGRYLPHFTSYTQNRFSNVDLAIKISDSYDWTTSSFTTVISDNTFQNNLFYVDGTDSTSTGIARILYHLDSNDPNGWTTPPITVSTFNTKNGSNNDTISNNIEGNPMFVDLATGDYHLQMNSPAKDSGITPLSTNDYDNNPIPYPSTLPDIGLYELQWATSINEITKRNSILVFPNPTNSLLNFRTNDNNLVKIQVINILGGIITSKTIKNNSQIDVSFLTEGVYFIKIKGNSEVLKFIKK